MTTVINPENLLHRAMVHQPILNIGVIGHVANGKSSIVKAVTGVETQKYASEKEKNITIKLGYANAKIYKCSVCKPPKCYQSGPSNEFKKACDICGENDIQLVTHISFVDAPGHHRFMSTMVSGGRIMDTTILVEALNNSILPAPQTREHVNAIKIGNIPNHIICLNKFDLIDKSTAYKHIETILDYFSGESVIAKSPLIPISATFGINIDVLLEYITKIQIPERNLDQDVKMIIVRSFNVNKAGINVSDIKGGVIGGSITRGKLNVGDIVELRPGIRSLVKESDVDSGKEKNLDKSKKKSKRQMPQWTFKPLITKVVSIYSEANELESAISGGLIGVQLDIDPALSATDGLIGNILTLHEKGNDVYEEIAIKYDLLDKDNIFTLGTKLSININACNTFGIITKIFEDNIVVVKLDQPISASTDDRATISNDEKILGVGFIVDGLKSVCI